VLAAASLARAEDPTTIAEGRAVIRLDATGDGCPDQVAFAHAVEQAIHVAPSASAPGLDFDVEIRATPSEANGFVILDGRRRTLRGRTCLEVAEGLALIVVVSIDPNAETLSPIHIVPASEQAHDPAAPPEPPERPAPAPVREAGRSTAPAGVRAFVAPLVGATSWLGGLPPNVGISLGATFGLPSAWRSQLLAEVSAFDASDLHLAGGTVHFGAWSGRLSACPWVFVSSPLEVAPCAGVVLMHVATQSQGFKLDQATSDTWASVSTDVRGRLALGARLGLFAGASAMASAGPRRWLLQNYGTVFSASAVTGELVVGADARF
jgi:hypothetical protein